MVVPKSIVLKIVDLKKIIKNENQTGIGFDETIYSVLSDFFNPEL